MHEPSVQITAVRKKVVRVPNFAETNCQTGAKAAQRKRGTPTERPDKAPPPFDAAPGPIMALT